MFQRCPDGFYSTGASSSCSSCPAGQKCFDGSVSTSPSDCSAGSYSAAGETTCTSCASGLLGLQFVWQKVFTCLMFTFTAFYFKVNLQYTWVWFYCYTKVLDTDLKKSKICPNLEPNLSSNTKKYHKRAITLFFKNIKMRKYYTICTWL